MKFKLHFLLILLALITKVYPATAQEVRFFRISGPATTAIILFNSDGTLVWSNALASTNYIVQTISSLSGSNNWVDYVQIPVTNGVNTNLIIDYNPPSGMMLIPAGSFTMGDNLDGFTDSLPLHTVYVSAFYMDKCEVTKGQWDNVYQWATNHGYSFTLRGAGKALNHPVQTVTWYDMVKWCNARSEKEGLMPAYYTTSAQTNVYKTGQVNVDNNSVNWDSGYRLPTEAEWEKAARGGLGGHRFPWGDTINQSQANYRSLAPAFPPYDVNLTSGYHPTFNDGVFPYTNPVGYFEPNGYGLYDMAGNVSERCWDWDGAYAIGSQSDPHGPTSSSYRVVRGGTWEGFVPECIVAVRIISNGPSYSDERLGFRCARPIDQ